MASRAWLLAALLLAAGTPVTDSLQRPAASGLTAARWVSSAAGPRAVRRWRTSPLPLSTEAETPQAVDETDEQAVTRLRGEVRALQLEVDDLIARQERFENATRQAQFAIFDLNGDGLVSQAEFRSCLKSRFAQSVTEKELDALFKEFGSGDGYLNETQFDAMRMRHRLLTPAAPVATVLTSSDGRTRVLVQQEPGQPGQDLDSMQMRTEATRQLMSILQDQRRQAAANQAGGNASATDSPWGELSPGNMAPLLDDNTDTTLWVRVVSCLPYLVPLFDSSNKAGLLASIPVVSAAVPTLTAVFGNSVLGFFFALLVAGNANNPSLPRILRFNIAQAFTLDLCRFIPDFLNFLTGDNFKQQLDYGTDVIIVVLIVYAWVAALANFPIEMKVDQNGFPVMGFSLPSPLALFQQSQSEISDVPLWSEPPPEPTDEPTSTKAEAAPPSAESTDEPADPADSTSNDDKTGP